MHLVCACSHYMHSRLVMCAVPRYIDLLVSEARSGAGTDLNGSDDHYSIVSDSALLRDMLLHY